MHPRLSRTGSPIGQRKKAKKEKGKKKSRKSPPPHPLHHCTCFDCVEYPGSHPETGLPCHGQWITRRELDSHSSTQRNRGVADSLLGPVLEAPRLVLPVPGEFGQLPCSSAGSGFESESTGSFSGYQRDVASSPFHAQLELPKSIKKLNEVTDWLQQIRSAESIISTQILVFKISPTASVDPALLTDHDFDMLCTLDPSIPSNSEVIGFQQVLSDAARWLDSNSIEQEQHREIRLKIKLLSSKVSREQCAVRRILKENWTHQARIAKLSYSFDSTRYYVDTFRLLPPIVLATYLLVATLHLICGLSIDHCSFVLGGLRIIVGLSMESATSVLAPHTKVAIYQDVRTVLTILDVEPRSKAYVSCPSCCRVYWIDPDNPNSYPDTCVNQETDQEVCGAKLKRNRKRRNGAVQLPVREFHYQCMHDYIARLYSRKDLQDYLYDDPTARHSYSSDAWDVWDAPCLRDFRGFDGRSPFADGQGKEGRLIFSLNMDGFNPFGNKEAGKKVSIGAIYMICLNLPPSLRYNIENVYLVGVIPGPREPSLHQINFFLKPLVDDLLTFWKTGVYLSRTLQYPHGFLIRCAVVPLVCDLPAARQMAGFAHYRSHHFCSICKQTLDDIQNIDYQTWTRRDHTDHWNAGMQWRDAPTQKMREESANVHGVRWSELLRLPYWDPTQFTVIDSMHTFYLRLFQHHCRTIWGMNIKFEDDGLASESRNQPPEEEMKEANEIFRFGMKTSLKSLRVAVLRQLCKETTTLNFHGKKAALVERLLAYRIRQGWFSENGQRLGQDPHESEILSELGQSAMEDQSILINPDIQPYIKDGIVLPHLSIRTLQDVEDYYTNATNSTIAKLTKHDLLTLFVHKVYPNHQLTTESVKRLIVAELRVLIHQQRKADGVIDERGRPKSKRAPSKKSCVLGRGVLAEIRHDMEHLHFPSWMAKAPSHPGEERWGKFSADQWKTFCIHVLPVTLIRLWGYKPEESLERRQLENFMHLVSAVKLATMRKVTEEVVTQYEYHMHSYLQSLQLLYPDLKLTPYQHLSLHFGEFLRRFGPTHAWRCFPFERYNYVMQNLPTNRIFGELETTLFRKFCHAQRIRSFFTLDTIPSVLLPLVDLFDKTFNKDTRGTRLSDVLFYGDQVDEADWTDAESAILPSDTFSLLLSWIRNNDDLVDDTAVQARAFQRSEIRRFGLRFTIASKSEDDSRVIIEHPRIATEWEAGCVQQFFSHTRERDDGSTVTQTFAVVSLHKRLSPADGALDPYQRYPVCGGRMLYNEFRNHHILVEVGQIKSHFAAFVTKSPELGRDFLLAQPLT